jgi:hypothetical protein
MSSSFHQNVSSYRDPSGFVFYKNGTLYRQVSNGFKTDFDKFVDSGLYKHLVEKNLLIPHKVIYENLTDSTNCYLTLQPEVVPFISYPYEWCFDMWKDAALLTLEAAKEAIQFGLMLKDASAYNIQLHQGTMIFIDTLSFVKYDEQKPWIAYRQFCEHFFAPLALMHYLKEPLQNLFIAYPDGLPLGMTSKMLPFKSKWNLHSYLHLHLQNSIAKKNKTKDEANKLFSKQKMKNLLQSLEDGISSFSFSQSSTVWSDYYEEASQRGSYLSSKKQIISDWLSKMAIKTVFDAGANEGEFSELAADFATLVISTDSDHGAITSLYQKIRRKRRSTIFPFIIDLVTPSPAIGLNNKERSSFLERINADLTLALALIHHLALGRNIPFDKIAEMFSFTGKYLIIEFVPKEDEMVKLIVRHRKELLEFYSEEKFLASFQRFFIILQKQEISNSGRTLYLMQKQNA